MPSQTRKSYLRNRIKGEFRSPAIQNLDKSEYELNILAGETQLETLQVCMKNVYDNKGILSSKASRNDAKTNMQLIPDTMRPS